MCYATQINLSTSKPLIITLMILGLSSLFLYFSGIIGKINPIGSDFSSPVTPGQTQTLNNSFTNSGSFELTIFSFMGIIIIILVSFFLYSRIQSQKDIDDAYKIDKTIVGTYGTIKYFLKPLTSKQHEISDIRCYNCGTNLMLKDKFCPNCKK